MFLALDCLKFYKLKSEWAARSLFIILYIMFMVFVSFPIGSIPDEAELFKLIQTRDLAGLSAITSENIYYAVSLLIFTLITSFFSVMYATIFVAEKEGFPAKKGITGSIRKLPSLALFVLALLVPSLISVIFVFIPLIFMYFSLFLAPVMITEGKMGIFAAMSESMRATHGYKLNIFITRLIISFAVSIPMSIFEMVFLFNGQTGSFASNLVISFFQAARVLIMGRLIGNFYLIAVKNKKDVLRVPVSDEKRENDHSSEDSDNDNDNDSDEETENKQ